MPMKVRIGTILAIVTITLTNAAVCTPRKVRKCTIHNRTDAPMMAGRVVPPSNCGKKYPSVANSSTR